MVKLYLDVSEVLHVNEDTKYANRDLHVLNFFVDIILLAL